MRPLADRFRDRTAKLARAWALTASAAVGNAELEKVRPDIRFFEEVRTWLAKIDAQDRISRGEPIPDDIARQFGNLIVTSATSDGVIDIYREAGLPFPDLQYLTPEWVKDAQADSKVHLAIQALKASLPDESRKVTGGNEVRRKQFSERINELMLKYTNQQLTAAEVLAELAELAKDVAAEADRGKDSDPPLSTDELAFYDVVHQNESAVDTMGDYILAAIARDLVATMRHDTRLDWTGSSVRMFERS